LDSRWIGEGFRNPAGSVIRFGTNWPGGVPLDRRGASASATASRLHSPTGCATASHHLPGAFSLRLPGLARPPSGCIRAVGGRRPWHRLEAASGLARLPWLAPWRPWPWLHALALAVALALRPWRLALRLLPRTPPPALAKARQWPPLAVWRCLALGAPWRLPVCPVALASRLGGLARFGLGFRLGLGGLDVGLGLGLRLAAGGVVPAFRQRLPVAAFGGFPACGLARLGGCLADFRLGGLGLAALLERPLAVAGNRQPQLQQKGVLGSTTPPN
jgi:hypothetical protein